jgi:glycosyltransferase involved in cell wall biosynthesis
MTSCLYLYRGTPIGSAKIHIDSMTAELEELGCEVHKYIPYAWGDQDDVIGRSLSKLRSMSPLLVTNGAQYLISRAFGSGLQKSLETLTPDFFYERYALFCKAGIKAAQNAGVPHILEVNSIIHTLDQVFLAAPLIPFARRTELEIFRDTDHVIAISKRIRDDLLEMGVEERRIGVMHNGVDPEIFKKNPGQAATLRRALGYSPEDFVLVISMGFDHRYIVDAVSEVLVRSVQRLAEERKGVKVLIIGGGKQFARARSRILSRFPPDRVYFTGIVPYQEVPYFLSVGDMAYIPWHVSFSSPLKLFEYMAMELPVVVPRLPGIMEIFDDTLGWSFEHQNFSDAEDVLFQGLNSRDRLIEMGRNARKKVLEKYTWESNAKRVLALVSKLAKM